MILNVNEEKTKPAQKSINELKSTGLNPDIVILRSKVECKKETFQKISSMCDIHMINIISCPDLEYVYDVPLFLNETLLVSLVFKKLLLYKKKYTANFLQRFYDISSKLHDENLPKITIGIVGKYTDVKDSYISLIKALEHACLYKNYKLVYTLIDSTNLKGISFKNYDGIVVPGGFGIKGTEGKLEAIKYCRENNVPFLGICYGFQLAIIELLRNVLNVKKATSIELEPESIENHCITVIDSDSLNNLGGSMVLGEHLVNFLNKTNLYDSQIIYERCRHRYEVSSDFYKYFNDSTLEFIATDSTGKRLTVFKSKVHDFFVGVQYHPEFLSKFYKPSSIFVKYIESILKRKFM